MLWIVQFQLLLSLLQFKKRQFLDHLPMSALLTLATTIVMEQGWNAFEIESWLWLQNLTSFFSTKHYIFKYQFQKVKIFYLLMIPNIFWSCWIVSYIHKATDLKLASHHLPSTQPLFSNSFKSQDCEITFMWNIHNFLCHVEINTNVNIPLLQISPPQ